jgi:hypothetical protein
MMLILQVFEITNTIPTGTAGTTSLITSIKVTNLEPVGTEFAVHVDNVFQVRFCLLFLN